MKQENQILLKKLNKLNEELQESERPSTISTTRCNCKPITPLTSKRVFRFPSKRPTIKNENKN